MDIKYLIVHAAATRSTMDIGAKEINDWHIARGWKGIGYHYVIRRDGKIEAGRPLNQPGAHTKGYNTISWGICLVGGIDSDGNAEDNFNEIQKESLRGLLFVLQRMSPGSKIVGHRDLSEDRNKDGIIEEWEWMKDCPCFDVSSFIAEGIPAKTPKRFKLW